MKCQVRSKTTGISPMPVPTSSASAALSTLFRSSRRSSRSGIWPSGFAARCACRTREPSTRAPVTVSAIFAIADPAVPAGSAGLLSPLCLRQRCVGRRGRPVHRGLLQVTELLLELLDLQLVLHHRSWRGLGGGPGGLCRRIIVVQVGDLGLENAHGLAERPGGIGQLL